MKSGREQFKKNKRIIGFLGKIVGILPRKLRLAMLNANRKVLGKKGIAIRYLLFRSLAKQCGDNVVIHPDVYLFHVENISIGDNVTIHPMCYLNGYSSIEIGSDVSIAHNVSILSFEHKWTDLSRKIKYNDIDPRPVKISDDVWIGCGSRILGGVTISSRVIISAGAVVKHDVESGVISGGVPNKTLKVIGKQESIDEYISID